MDVEEKERSDGMERARVLLCLLRTAFEHEIENKHDDVVDDKIGVPYNDFAYKTIMAMVMGSACHSCGWGIYLYLYKFIYVN